MITHVPLLAHGEAKDVLIIGGGDGGTLKETLKYPVESVTLVELDAKIIELTQRYLPAIAGEAFVDRRLSVVIGDGARYIGDTERKFDVIIVDSTNPIGPAEALFTDGFYGGCESALRTNGLISIQSSYPFYQPVQIEQMLSRLRDRIGAASTFLAPVPTYASGLLALMIAGRKDSFVPGLDELQRRPEMIGLATHYYSPAVHQAAFAMAPRFDSRLDYEQPEGRWVARLPEWIASRSLGEQLPLAPRAEARNSRKGNWSGVR